MNVRMGLQLIPEVQLPEEVSTCVSRRPLHRRVHVPMESLAEEYHKLLFNL